MHVVHLIDVLRLGGAQTLLATFAEAAPCYDVQTTVIALRHDPGFVVADDLRAFGVDVHFVSSRSLLDPVPVAKIARLLRHGEYDVLHTHLTYANILGPLIGRLARLPVVSTLHNAEPDKLRGRDPLEAWALRYGANRIVAVGDIVAHANRQRLRGRQVEVVANAVPSMPRLSNAEREAVRAEFVDDATTTILLAVGRLTQQKGYDDLLTAFSIVHASHPRAILLIAGTGSEHDALASQIEELGLERFAKLLGPRSDIPRLLAASDIFVSSSRWEGLPVAVLEAMAAGLPVVATAVGDILTVLDSSTGILVPAQEPTRLAEALRSLLDSPDLQRQLGDAARSRAVECFGVDGWMRRLIALYADIRNTPAPERGQTSPTPEQIR